MRTSSRTEAALHCVLVLTWANGEAVPSAALAELFDLPPAYLNKTLQMLARAGVIESVPGAGGGFRVARPASTITLADIMTAVEGREPLFRCDEIRLHGTAASPQPPKRPCGIASAMRRAELAYRRELAAQTVADIAEATASGPKARALAALGR